MLLQENVALAPLTTIRVGGAARYFVEAKTVGEVQEAVIFSQSRNLPLFVLGGGSNLVVADAGWPGLILKVSIPGIDKRSASSEDGKMLFNVGAGESWDRFVWHAVMAQGGGGVIINIGSISSIIVNRPQWQPAYNASKAAVHQLTKSLAAEWAARNIRVNALAPGYVKTEMAPVDRPEFRRYWIEDTPMQRYATPEEIAPSVVYLASDASSFMTGSVLVLDGGYTIF